jgi:carbon storage regulator CsrA
MLILSRRENEKILFPNLGVTVGIVRIRGNAVRVGIEAPEGVRVLREEIADEQALQASRAAFDPLRKLRHELRNRLNTANLALHLVQKQMETGKSHDAESALRKALEELHVLDREIGEKTRSFNRKNAVRHHALVVEDNANERELLAGCLRLYGFDVDAVEDGLSALHFLEQRQGARIASCSTCRCPGSTAPALSRQSAATPNGTTSGFSPSPAPNGTSPTFPSGRRVWTAGLSSRSTRRNCLTS